MTSHSSLNRNQQRYLDGEPHTPLSDAERAEADRFAAGVRAWGTQLIPPGNELDAAVMARIAERPTRRGAIGWLLQPRVIRLRPVWIPVAAAAAVLLWIGTRSVPPTPAPPVAVAAAQLPDTVFVRFELVAPNAHSVSLAGSFNGWQPAGVKLVRRDGGLWSATIALPIGEYEYQFVVDGDRWIPDPTAHAQVQDGFGGTNSVIVVGPRGVVRS